MTSFPGFSQEDFAVFSIAGLDQRMEAIKTRIRPKFAMLADHFTPLLEAATGSEMIAHVAKHARRTVNPPMDTWIAWASDKRGYKKHPHFQIGLWGTHLFIWYAVIYESPVKEQIGQALEKHIDEILQTVPAAFCWSPDHTKPKSMAQSELGKDGVLRLIERLQTVKKAELLCGVTIDRNDPILRNGPQLLQKMEDTFAILTKLYNLARPSLAASAR